MSSTAETDGDSAPEWVLATQKGLGTLISKPKLSDKYLRKPPFRFLHDIITEVIKVTGFAKELYNEDEMDAVKVSADKQSKIDFLNKFIACIFFSIDSENKQRNQLLEVSANKIVAGLEPEKTNVLLQFLYEASTRCLSESPLAVKKVLSGEVPIESRVNRPASMGKPQQVTRVDDVPSLPSSAAPTASSEIKPSNALKPSGGIGSQDSVPVTPVIQTDELPRRPETSGKAQQPLQSTNGHTNTTEGVSIDNNVSRSAVVQSRGGVFSNAKSVEPPSITQIEESFPPPPAPFQQQPDRPRTAQKRPPRSAKEETMSTGFYETASMLGTPPRVVADGELNRIQQSGLPVINESPSPTGDLGTHHGALVRDILESSSTERTNEEVVYRGLKMEKLKKKKSTEGTSTNVSGGIDYEKLKGSVQRLVQSAVPLAKILEYFSVDVIAMAKEIEETKAEVHKSSIKLANERKQTEEELAPGQRKLKSIEVSISEILKEIEDTREKVYLLEDEVSQAIESLVCSKRE